MCIQIKFPFIHRFEDYHEIPYLAQDLTDIFNHKIEAKELGEFFNAQSRRPYAAVFYIGQEPSVEEIRKLAVLLDKK